MQPMPAGAPWRIAALSDGGDQSPVFGQLFGGFGSDYLRLAAWRIHATGHGALLVTLGSRGPNPGRPSGAQGFPSADESTSWPESGRLQCPLKTLSPGGDVQPVGLTRSRCRVHNAR